MTKTAYITIGLPASGKTTWAKAKEKTSNAVRINNDDIRNEIYKSLGHRNWDKWIESMVRNRRTEAIKVNASIGNDIIIDNTHMNHRTLTETIRLAESVGYTVELVDFRNITVEECIKRDALRPDGERVGEQVIRKMAKMDTNQWKPERDELPEFDPGGDKWPCVIVDIDGTLATRRNRSPYDETRVYDDLPRMHVLWAVEALQRFKNVELIIFSGRSDSCYEDTERWLEEVCGLKDFKLYMRKTGDTRRDSLVKMDLYNQHVKGQYNVVAVFDDRAQVIRECWAVLNLPVFRCGVIDKDEF